MNEDDRALLNFWEAERPDNKLQIPISKLQRSTKLQAQKPTCAPFAPASVFGVWCFEILNFSGAWVLVLGVWLGGGSKTEMGPDESLTWFSSSLPVPAFQFPYVAIINASTLQSSARKCPCSKSKTSSWSLAPATWPSARWTIFR